MSKFILKIVLFFLLVFVLDCSIGYCLDYMNSHQKGNFTKDLYHGIMQSDEDILIFGSSRAMNHYVPKVIEDSLDLSCYNCGYAGEGAVFHNGRIRKILQRYSPKLIIYDIEPNFDIAISPNERFLDRIKPNANDSCVRNYIKEFSYDEYLKTFSRLYCYNALFYDILKGYFTFSDLSQKGYRPLFGSNAKNAPNAGKCTTVDSLKMKSIEEIIKTCQSHDIPLLFFSSPRYGWTTSEELESVKEICKKYNTPYYDFYSNNDMTRNDTLFFTSGHFNDNGAHYYTSKIIPIIKGHLHQK